MDGDKNTTFFHRIASSRHRHNKIHMVVNDFGREYTDQSDIEDVFRNYFVDLFSTTFPTIIDEILRDVNCHLSTSNIFVLSKDFSKGEVKAVIDGG